MWNGRYSVAGGIKKKNILTCNSYTLHGNPQRLASRPLDFILVHENVSPQFKLVYFELISCWSCMVLTDHPSTNILILVPVYSRFISLSGLVDKQWQSAKPCFSFLRLCPQGGSICQEHRSHSRDAGHIPQQNVTHLVYDSLH